MVGERVPDFERPELAVAEDPRAGLGIVGAEQAVSREVHDVVAPIAQQRAQVRTRQAAVNACVACAIEIDYAARSLRVAREPAGHLLGLIARTR